MKDKKAPSQNFQDKPRKEVKTRDKVNPSDIVNLKYNGFRVSLVGDADRMAWNALDRPGRRNHVKNLQRLINKGIMKSIDIPYKTPDQSETEEPKTVMLMVPGAYKGDGTELLDLIQDDKKEEPGLRAVK